MANTVHLQSDWGDEHHPHYTSCPMCGSTEQDTNDHSITTEQMLRLIGLMLLHNPIGLDTVFLRTMFGWTLEEIGQRHFCSRQAVEQALRKLKKEFVGIDKVVKLASAKHTVKEG